MCRYRIISSPNQPVPRFDSSRNHSKSTDPKPLALLQTAMAACLSVVMICSIIGAGFRARVEAFLQGRTRVRTMVQVEVDPGTTAPS